MVPTSVGADSESDVETESESESYDSESSYSDSEQVHIGHVSATIDTCTLAQGLETEAAHFLQLFMCIYRPFTHAWAKGILMTFEI